MSRKKGKKLWIFPTGHDESNLQQRTCYVIICHILNPLREKLNHWVWPMSWRTPSLTVIACTLGNETTYSAARSRNGKLILWQLIQNSEYHLMASKSPKANTLWQWFSKKKKKRDSIYWFSFHHVSPYSFELSFVFILILLIRHFPLYIFYYLF